MFSSMCPGPALWSASTCSCPPAKRRIREKFFRLSPGTPTVSPLGGAIPVDQCLAAVLARWAFCDSQRCEEEAETEVPEITVRLRLAGQREGYLYLGISRSL